jgi:hypothetical protein
MYSVIDILVLPRMGSPIQRSPDQSLFSGSPKLIAAYHVFHRHPAPRHPPSALSSLAIIIYHYECYFTNYYYFLLRHFWNHFFCIQFSKNLLRLFSPWAQSSKLKILLRWFWVFNLEHGMVEVIRFELTTSCVQGRRSPNWATPPHPLVGLVGIEPTTSRLSGVRSNRDWAIGPFRLQNGDSGLRIYIPLRNPNSKIRIRLALSKLNSDYRLRMT